MRERLIILLLSLILAGAGSVILARQGYMEIKAMLAEEFIEMAFRDHLADGKPHLPWNWADMHPVGRLQVERSGMVRHILTGATGESLAFGLGHLDGTPLPNRPGNCVVAGHRDSWAAFLSELEPGDRLELVSLFGSRHWYVERLMVVPEDDASIMEETAGDRLTLVTCYPFDGLVRSPLRYVVRCLPMTS